MTSYVIHWQPLYKLVPELAVQFRSRYLFHYCQPYLDIYMQVGCREWKQFSGNQLNQNTTKAPNII